jgi:hypothetical protein
MADRSGPSANPAPLFPAQCRTFGELATLKAGRGDNRRLCSFCKVQDKMVFTYSTRRAVCYDCAAERADVVLPRVKRREKFDALMRKAASPSSVSEVSK